MPKPVYTYVRFVIFNLGDEKLGLVNIESAVIAKSCILLQKYLLENIKTTVSKVYVITL